MLGCVTQFSDGHLHCLHRHKNAVDDVLGLDQPAIPVTSIIPYSSAVSGGELAVIHTHCDVLMLQAHGSNPSINPPSITDHLKGAHQWGSYS
jgi:hypothetical protein